MRFEPAGMTDDPDIRFASSIMDYLFRRLALEYLTYDERAELGIFSIDERLQPTLPGVEESVIETRTGSEIAADPKSIPSADELVAQLDLGTRPAGAEQRHHQPRWHRPSGWRRHRKVRQSDAPMCMQCGVQMIRAGSCHACPSCGDQRLQLIRLNSWPAGPAGHGLFVMFIDEPADRGGVDSETLTASDLDQFEAMMADAAS